MPAGAADDGADPGRRRARPWTVVAAPNAFKGALSAPAAAEAVAAGVRAAAPEAEVHLLPIADGGDGTAAVLAAGSGGRWIETVAPDAWGRPRRAGLALLPGGVAVVDIAAASGLGRRRPGPAEAAAATSAGTGHLIARARALGAKRIWVALGGSACTDGGTGLLGALGARFYDAAGRPLPPGGAALRDLARVDLGGLPDLGDTAWTALVDVRNPLLGPEGAAAVYGPQKGAGPAEVAALEAGLSRLAEVLEASGAPRVRGLPGAGAAGGCGFGLAAVLGADLRAGAEVVCGALGLPARVREADLLVTGEGRLDAQTAFGKAPGTAAALAAEAGVPAVALAGELGRGWEALLRPRGPLTAALSLAPGPRTRAAALRATADDLARAAGTAVRLLLGGAQAAGAEGRPGERG